MNPLLPLALLVPAGLGLVVALMKSSESSAAPPPLQLPPPSSEPTPEEAAAAMSSAELHDQAAASHATDALAASADHAAATDATANALDKSAAAERQVAESQTAQQNAQNAYDAAAELAKRKAAQNDVTGAAAAASLALEHKAQADREAAAAAQAAAEAKRQRDLAAATAAKALQAKQRKDAAAAKAAAAKQKADAARATVKSSSSSAATLKLAATALRDYLQQHASSNAAFGVKGAPSQAVADFQGVATKNGHPLTKDGIVGPLTRSVAELVGVTLPPRPAAAATPPATPPASSSQPGTHTFDAAAARALAAQVEKNLRNPPAGNVYNYDRNLMKRFQLAAGLVADGEYGGRTRGALIYFGASSAPKALFAPTATVTYHPPA